MNIDRSLIFSHLEEDNVQRAYFRVRPLLTLEGDVREEAIQLWPAEGGLRIVPDRNEQHTFKGRMRSLGAYCVVDLRNQPAEAGKIRTNKNFRPERGEVNQYILYSDTVHPLPEHTFYQLLDGKAADFAVLAGSSITPRFFIREENTLYGPVSKVAPAMPEPAAEASAMLFDLPCPDGVSRMMLCLDDAPEHEAEVPEASEDLPTPEPAPVQPDTSPVKAAETKDEALPIGKPLQILDKGKSTDATLKQLDKPVSAGANLLRQQPGKPLADLPKPTTPSGALSGTPLIRAPLHVSMQQHKNRTQEVVSNQWNVGKYEPPAHELPAGAQMRSVQNPVEAACNQLRTAWNASSAHDRLIDCILSLDGIRSQLEAKLCKGSNMTIMQRVLRDRLQDLEAERLSALCELDKAHKDVDAYKQELINGLTARINRETAQLKADQAEAEAAVNTLKASINALTLQRDALLTKVDELQGSVLPETVAKLIADAQMVTPSAGIPLRITPVSGQDASTDEVLQRLMDTCHASGIEITRNAAIVLLVLLAFCPRIGLRCTTPAPISTLAANIAAALGWQHSYAHQTDAEQRPVVGLRPTDGTPAVLMTSLSNYAAMPGLTKLTLVKSAEQLCQNSSYAAQPWPVLPIPALAFIPELELPDAAPISASALEHFCEKPAVSDGELDAILSPILAAAAPLSGASKKELYRFISICAGLLEGGLPVAVDWGILLWIIPSLIVGSKEAAAIKPLLDEYPLSLAQL